MTGGDKRAGCSWDDEQCPGYRRVCKHDWWTKAIMIAIIAAITAGAVAIGAVGAIVGSVLAKYNLDEPATSLNDMSPLCKSKFLQLSKIQQQRSLAISV